MSDFDRDPEGYLEGLIAYGEQSGMIVVYASANSFQQ